MSIVLIIFWFDVLAAFICAATERFFLCGVNVVLAVLLAFIAMVYEGRLLNRVKKLEKNHVSREQLEKAQSALKQFRKEAGQRKKQIQNGELSTVQFMNWMIGQEAIIQEICGG